MKIFSEKAVRTITLLTPLVYYSIIDRNSIKLQILILSLMEVRLSLAKLSFCAWRIS